MASPRLEDAARNAASAIRQIQNALDLAERVTPFYNVEGLATELNAITNDSDAVVTDGGGRVEIDKRKALDLITMVANLTYYLRAQEAAGNNTLLGSSPLNVANLRSLMEKLVF